jgi:hypothetical protein
MFRGLGCENLKKKRPLDDLGANGSMLWKEKAL